MITLHQDTFNVLIVAAFAAGEIFGAIAFIYFFILRPRRHTEEQAKTGLNHPQSREAAGDPLCTVAPLTLDEHHRIQSGYFKGAILQTRGDL